MQTITRDDLAHILVENMGLKKTQAREFVGAFFQAVIESIAQGSRIEVRGFGVFEIKEVRPAKRRNPRTGKRIVLPVRRKVHFRPGKVLKQALSQPPETD